MPSSRKKYKDEDREKVDEKKPQSSPGDSGTDGSDARACPETGASEPASAVEDGDEKLPEGTDGNRSEITCEGERTKLFPVVGIGASAGGLGALEELFANVRKESGMAYVVISHTDPSRTSILPQILQKHTQLRVVEVTDGLTVEPDKVYLPPSNKDLVLADDTFFLKPISKLASPRLPIDFFLRSLADSFGEWAVCVILSGTGTDGTLGLRAMKERGGLIVAQSEQTARHPGMPQSAMGTGLVDMVLAPGEMPEKIAEYFSQGRGVALEADAEGDDLSGTLGKVVAFLRARIGHDFSQYKKSTLLRRIQRRMSITRMSRPSEYLNYLYRHPDEVNLLFQDLLISVTSFFRDPESFEFIAREVIPGLISRTNENRPVRVWTAGCSTGEEAYSIAILFYEVMEALKVKRDFQIFATDIDGLAIDRAREGLYPQNIAADVNTERLKRFFTREDNFYRVRKEIRDPVVFAVQNVLRDPPFSRLDLLICRNLLIYLEAEAQRKLIPLFHHTLNPGGYLFLGPSETIGSFSELFSIVSKKRNIYKKLGVSAGIQPAIDFPTGGKPRAFGFDPYQVIDVRVVEPGIAESTQRILLEHHSPVCAVVNRRGDISYIHGRSGKYLEPASGHPSLNITDMAREGLRFELAASLRMVVAKNEPVVRRGIRVKTNGDYQEVNLIVKPMEEPKSLKDMILVVFEDVPRGSEPGGAEKAGASTADVNRRISDLESELAKVRQDHRTAMEELETSNEELKSVNEELQSSNEELQSTNEELESSREELQSLNEELSTVNAELHERIQEVSDTYRSITEVLNNTRIAIIFLDRDLNVQRFTDEASAIINLIESDVGRPLRHVSANLRETDLWVEVSRVREGLKPVEKEVETNDGRWYLMRIVPARNEDLILTFINLDSLKAAEKQIEQLQQNGRDGDAYAGKEDEGNGEAEEGGNTGRNGDDEGNFETP